MTADALQRVFEFLQFGVKDDGISSITGEKAADMISANLANLLDKCEKNFLPQYRYESRPGEEDAWSRNKTPNPELAMQVQMRLIKVFEMLEPILSKKANLSWENSLVHMSMLAFSCNPAVRKQSKRIVETNRTSLEFLLPSNYWYFFDAIEDEIKRLQRRIGRFFEHAEYLSKEGVEHGDPRVKLRGFAKGVVCALNLSNIKCKNASDRECFKWESLCIDIMRTCFENYVANEKVRIFLLQHWQTRVTTKEKSSTVSIHDSQLLPGASYMDFDVIENWIEEYETKELLAQHLSADKRRFIFFSKNENINSFLDVHLEREVILSCLVSTGLTE